MDAGSEAQIPPELIQQAYQQLQQEQAEAKQRQATRRQQLKVGRCDRNYRNPTRNTVVRRDLQPSQRC